MKKSLFSIRKLFWCKTYTADVNLQVLHFFISELTVDTCNFFLYVFTKFFRIIKQNEAHMPFTYIYQRKERHMPFYLYTCNFTLIYQRKEIYNAISLRFIK